VTLHVVVLRLAEVLRWSNDPAPPALPRRAAPGRTGANIPAVP